jgi:hypothetical protein
LKLQKVTQSIAASTSNAAFEPESFCSITSERMEMDEEQEERSKQAVEQTSMTEFGREKKNSRDANAFHNFPSSSSAHFLSSESEGDSLHSIVSE